MIPMAGTGASKRIASASPTIFRRRRDLIMIPFQTNVNSCRIVTLSPILSTYSKWGLLAKFKTFDFNNFLNYVHTVVLTECLDFGVQLLFPGPG